MKALAPALALLGIMAAGDAQARAHLRQYQQRLMPDYAPSGPPENYPPLPQGFTMNITRFVGAQAPAGPGDAESLDTARAIAERLAACWQPPPQGSDETSQVTLRLAFTRQGGVIAKPRITYAATSGGSEAVRALRQSILDGVEACLPLRFTPGLGSAIAGVPFTIRFIARRAPSQH